MEVIWRIVLPAFLLEKEGSYVNDVESGVLKKRMRVRPILVRSKALKSSPINKLVSSFRLRPCRKRRRGMLTKVE